MSEEKRLSKPFPDPNGSLMVNNIYMTIMGGLNSGEPAVAVSLSKCNQQCWFCNVDYEEGDVHKLPELVDAIRAYGSRYCCSNVLITGGEPLLQNVFPLIDILNGHGMVVTLETAGTIYVHHLDKYFDSLRTINNNLLICSPKTSTVVPEIVDIVGAWNYVVEVGSCENEYGLPVFSTQAWKGHPKPVYRAPRDGTPIFLQPLDSDIFGVYEANARYAARVCLKHGHRLNIDMSDYLGA